MLWVFSIYVEAAAAIPQIYLLTVSQECHNLTWHYVATLGAYRLFYVLNWVWRFMTENHYRQWFVTLLGLIQTAIYLDFLYYYVTATMQGRRFRLPGAFDD